MPLKGLHKSRAISEHKRASQLERVSIAKQLRAFGVIAIAKANSTKCIGYGIMQLALIYLSRDQFPKLCKTVLTYANRYFRMLTKFKDNCSK